MGTLFKYYQLLFCTFLFLFTVPTSSSSPHDQTRPKTQTQTHSSSSSSTAQYQVFYIKNTAPFLLDEQDRHPRRLNKKRAVIGGGKRKNKKASTSTTTKKFKNNGPFSVMLPKGFVPPSGSSPCHNGNPNSVVFFCDLAKP